MRKLKFVNHSMPEKRYSDSIPEEFRDWDDFGADDDDDRRIWLWDGQKLRQTLQGQDWQSHGDV